MERTMNWKLKEQFMPSFVIEQSTYNQIVPVLESTLQYSKLICKWLLDSVFLFHKLFKKTEMKSVLNISGNLTNVSPHDSDTV